MTRCVLLFAAWLTLALPAPAAPSAAVELRPRMVAGGIEFALRAPAARSVTIAGDFNGWSTGNRPLSGPDGAGDWSIVLALPPGDHEYLLLIDGQRPSRGLRVERPEYLAFQTHQPLDMRVRWLVPVFVCHVLPGGVLRAEPDNAALFAMLDAGRLAVCDSSKLYPREYERALGKLRHALVKAPRDSALRRMLEQVESGYRDERGVLEALRRARERDLESVALPLLRSSFLSAGEKDRVRTAIRSIRESGFDRGSCEPLARLEQRVYSRARVEAQMRRWRESPGDPDVACELRLVLRGAYEASDPAGYEAWSALLTRSVWGEPLPSGIRDVESYLEAARRIGRPGERADGLKRILECLRSQGIPAWAVALDARLLPREDQAGAGLWLLDRLGDRPEVRRDFLLRVLPSAAPLRGEPVVEKMLADELGRASHPLIAQALASRLCGLYMVAHREAEFFGLLGRRLEADPCDLKLLEDFDSFLETMRRLQAAYRGLLANPWKPGLLERLERLRKTAPANPVVLRMLARELEDARRSEEAAGLRPSVPARLVPPARLPAVLTRRAAIRQALAAGNVAEVESLVAAPVEGASQAELWHYAFLAALSRGRDVEAARWLERALDLARPRRWLLDALDGPSESLAGRVAEEVAGTRPGADRLRASRLAQLAGAQNPAPFLRFLAARELAAGRPASAAAYLRALLGLVMLPEDVASLEAGLVLAELRALRPVVALQELGSLLFAGPAAFLFLASGALLPVLFIGILARWPWRRG